MGTVYVRASRRAKAYVRNLGIKIPRNSKAGKSIRQKRLYDKLKYAITGAKGRRRMSLAKRLDIVRFYGR